MRDRWLGNDPLILTAHACSTRNLSRSARLLRLASCAACRLMPYLRPDFRGYGRKQASDFLAAAESAADGIEGDGARRAARRAALDWVADLSHRRVVLEYIEYARCVAGTLSDEGELAYALQTAARGVAMAPVTDPEPSKYALCNAIRDIFGDGVEEDLGWELRRPSLPWKWYGPMPPPMQWREPALSRWRNDGLIRPRWACDPVGWRETRDIHHGILEAQFTSGLLPTRQVQILGDCLEEYGCDDEALLIHLHGPGPHFRGCWAIDSLEGKE